MADRIELTSQEMDEVVGGMFHYQYNRKGQLLCKVDGIGAYYAAENAKRKINQYEAKHPGASDQELVDYALDEGLFWR